MQLELHFLIDECLHTSLATVAHERGYAAEHVAHVGLRTCKDYEVMAYVREHDHTFVTNNAVDFRKLFSKEAIHAGLVIIIPNVPPKHQAELFAAALDEIGEGELLNEVVEVSLDGKHNIVVERYPLPTVTK